MGGYRWSSNLMWTGTVSVIVLHVVEESGAFAADLLRGHTETIVLGVLSRGDRYGFEIFKAIRDATGGAYGIKEATLYASYRRLVRDGLVEAYWGDESQGGRRKYYRITDAGRAEYRRSVQAWVITRGIIDALLGTDRTTVVRQLGKAAHP